MAAAPPSSDDALEVVFAALDQVNLQQEPAKRVPKTRDAVLFGERGTLDSLGLLTFAAAVEELVLERFQRPVKVMDEDLLGQPEGPLSRVDKLVDYLVRELSA